MKWSNRLFNPVHQWKRTLDPTSLRVRLTLGVVIVLFLGLGGVATWISWRMQHILVATHKQNIKYIADRFPHDVEIYSDMVSLSEGMQKAIDNLTTSTTLLWVKSPQGKMSAQSMPMKVGSNGKILTSLTNISLQPQLQSVEDRYWLLCEMPLTVRDVNLGTITIAQDITGDQTMFLSLMKSLSLASLIALSFMSIAIAWYIGRSLKPLQNISQIAAKVSADRLSEAHIRLENAPSEVKELAQTVDKMLFRLNQAWEHQRQLVSDVSHELRTPLTVVSGYLQSTLRRGHNLTSPQREALEIAASEADRTIQLLQDLLDLARADSGQMPFALETVVLNTLIDEVVGMARQFSDRPIEFSFPPEMIVATVDINRFKQILLNLIDNAVKYSDAQSQVTVKLTSAKGAAKIQVCDRGIGIPLQHQSRIFERFYRVDEARCRATGGTGLGLSIVQTLVEGMGGTIAVASQLGKGSTFTVTLPLD